MTSFDDFHSDSTAYYPSPTRLLHDYLSNHDLRGKTGLDIGAGNGRNSLALAARGARVFASDSSAVAMHNLQERAKQSGLEISCRVRDARLIRREEVGHPDFVVASTILDHISRAAADRLLSALAESLASEGWIYVSVFTLEDPSYTHAAGASETAQFVVNHYGANELLRILLGLGLRLRQYSETVERDDSHGPPHVHGIARAIAERT